MIWSGQVLVIFIVENFTSWINTPLNFFLTYIFGYIILAYRGVWLLLFLFFKIYKTSAFRVTIWHKNCTSFVQFCLVIFVHYYCNFLRINYIEFAFNFIIEWRWGSPSFFDKLRSKNICFWSISLGSCTIWSCARDINIYRSISRVSYFCKSEKH